METDGSERDSETQYESFKAGVRQMTWTDENGENCDLMIVYPDGKVAYSKHSGVQPDAVWYFWYE